MDWFLPPGCSWENAVFILSGSLEVYHADELIARRGDGETMGVVAALLQFEHIFPPTAVRAATRTEALEIPRRALEAAVQRSPAAMSQLEVIEAEFFAIRFWYQVCFNAVADFEVYA